MPVVIRGFDFELPGAHLLEQVRFQVYKVLYPLTCLGCGASTTWACYRFPAKPVGTCSGECLRKLEEAMQEAANEEE